MAYVRGVFVCLRSCICMRGGTPCRYVASMQSYAAASPPGAHESVQAQYARYGSPQYYAHEQQYEQYDVSQYEQAAAGQMSQMAYSQMANGQMAYASNGQQHMGSSHGSPSAVNGLNKVAAMPVGGSGAVPAG